MKRMWMTLRISLGLVSVMAIILSVAQLVGLFPDKRQTLAAERKSLGEVVAINCSLAASKQDWKSMEAAVRAVTDRSPDILSVVVRRANGSVTTDARKSAEDIQAASIRPGNSWRIEIPIFMGKNKWGTAEMEFSPLESGGSFGFIHNPFLQLTLFVTGLCMLGFTFYLQRVFSYLDPKTVVPHHVRNAFDTLTEGVIVLDKQQRIVLANDSFSRLVGRPFEEIQGLRISEIGWIGSNDAESPDT